MQPVLSGDLLKLNTKLKFSDEFDGDLSKWNQDTFEDDGLHITGYDFIENNGQINLNKKWQTVPGRWAALMNKHRDKVQFIENEMLVLKPYVVNQPNPYRVDVVGADGLIKPLGQVTPYAPWLSTWARKNHPDENRKITDWDQTSLLFGKGSVVECRVNLERQRMGGVRFSMWPMPATKGLDTPTHPARDVSGESYNTDSSIMEIDTPEVENPQRYSDDFGHYAFMKCIGGLAGDTPQLEKDLRKFGINLRVGWHTFTLVWNLDGTLKFICDGVVINEEKRSLDFNAYLILSCEMNSGLKDPKRGPVQPHETLANGVKAPHDPGLSARCWIDDIALVDEHEVLVDYVRVFDIIDDSKKQTVSADSSTVLNTDPPTLVKRAELLTDDVNKKVEALGDMFEIKSRRLDALQLRYSKLKRKKEIVDSENAEHKTRIKTLSAEAKQAKDKLNEMDVLNLTTLEFEPHNVVNESTLNRLKRLLGDRVR